MDPGEKQDWTSQEDDLPPLIQLINEHLDQGKPGLPGSCPDEYLCPISNQVMTNPVILLTGYTYDMGSLLQKWMASSAKTCPICGCIVPNSVLTPNRALDKMIKSWSRDTNFPLPQKAAFTEEHGEYYLLFVLLELSSSSPADQKAVAKTLRSLTEEKPSFLLFFGKIHGAISQICMHLSKKVDQDLEDDLFAVLLSIICHEENLKTAIHEGLVPFLLDNIRQRVYIDKSLKILILTTENNHAFIELSLSHNQAADCLVTLLFITVEL